MSDPNDDDVPEHELEYLDDRDESYPRSWQDVAADELGIPRWGPI